MGNKRKKIKKGKVPDDLNELLTYLLNLSKLTFNEEVALDKADKESHLRKKVMTYTI